MLSILILFVLLSGGALPLTSAYLREQRRGQNQYESRA
ncbi:hypothetical protein CcrColossus_gp151 [Caulobacter phage CcrColossus]|uniref:Uncharacterized protein n=1 Tax=Caulobacter phage CcrColossus TaxID=1211640 RepID=K4JSD6_9CAUD|nr:hypothetical protein CcrColossus_gp151 [Caulobacter phage CcrColossus]AFU88021.1 hypothetical protein CcrColossus_gp151 [Caulobacter phage CcrColossus]